MVDGKLVEVLHVDEAKRTLALQRNIEALQVRAHSAAVVCVMCVWFADGFGLGGLGRPVSVSQPHVNPQLTMLI